MPFTTRSKRWRRKHRYLPPQRLVVFCPASPEYLLCITLISIFFVAETCFSDERDQRVQVWLHRTTNAVDAIMADPAVESHRKTYHLSVTAGAFGLHGYIAEFNGLCKRAALGEDSLLRQDGLMHLVGGLSSRNRVEDAFSVASSMPDGPQKAIAYGLIPIRQAQNGNFEKAELLLNRVPDARAKDSAISQICREYAELRKFDEANRLCDSIANDESRSRMVEWLEEERKQPAVDDPAYVDFRLNEARNHPLVSFSESRLGFLSHLYKAEVVLRCDDQEAFIEQAQEAKRRLELGHATDGDLLVLARLMHQAGQKDEARLLYLRLFDKYKQEEDDAAFDFNKILFCAGKPSNAEIVVECLSDQDLKLVIHKLADVKSSRLVVAAMFGVVVSRQNPDWAEDVYEAVSDIEFKAELASYCLTMLASS